MHQNVGLAAGMAANSEIAMGEIILQMRLQPNEFGLPNETRDRQTHLGHGIQI